MWNTTINRRIEYHIPGLFQKGIYNDVVKLGKITSGDKYILILTTENPDRGDNGDWSKGVDKFNQRFEPLQIRSLTDPSNFPQVHFLGLLEFTCQLGAIGVYSKKLLGGLTMGVVDIIILIGGALFVIEGVIKLLKPDFRIRGNPPPCGAAMVILGAGLLLKAVGL